MSLRNNLLIILSLLCAPVVKAQQNTVADPLQISLLTCAPGDEAYELYGHTALRVIDREEGKDLVFNYGIFDFDTPNFAWRFMLGQTDYTIGVNHFERFAHSYQRRGRCIVEQVLNLTAEEEQRLYEALVSDWSQPGWTYRYNFIYDNCTTRAVNQVKKAVSGKLVLPMIESGRRSFREMLHEFSEENSPWYTFGEDLILGAEIDQPIDVSKQMFSPVYAQRFFDRAYIQDPEGIRRPLVADEQMVVQAVTAENKAFPISPLVLMGLLSAATLGWTYREVRRKQICHAVDNTLMVIQGLVGCLVAFLFFVSEHPAVGSNWLILLFNPLPLVYLPIKIRHDRNGKKDYYPYVLLAVLLVLGGVATFKMQTFPVAFHFVALILLIRALVSISLPTSRPASSLSKGRQK